MKSEVFDIKDRTYQYALSIIKLLEGLQKDIASDVIARQLIRSATSIGANLEEGKSASSRKDFINYYNHSLKSANESRFWLLLLKDTGKSSGQVLDGLIDETSEIANILASCIISLRRKSEFVS